jgi:DNA-binding transcriptional regulator YdaS (Cro superfamily)
MKKEHRIALLKACHIVGGQKQLAEKIKVDPSRLNKWLNRNKGSIPFQCALDIETATSGQVTCYELVPRWEEAVEHCQQNKAEINDTSHVPCVNSSKTDRVLENKNAVDLTQDKKDKK